MGAPHLQTHHTPFLSSILYSSTNVSSLLDLLLHTEFTECNTNTHGYHRLENNREGGIGWILNIKCVKTHWALGGLVKWPYKTRIGPQTIDSFGWVIGFKDGQFQFIWIGADLPETNINVLFLIFKTPPKKPRSISQTDGIFINRNWNTPLHQISDQTLLILWTLDLFDYT